MADQPAPDHLPYSNPTSRPNAAPKRPNRWSDGRAVFASGSPSPGRDRAADISCRVRATTSTSSRHGNGGVRHRAKTGDRGNVHRRQRAPWPRQVTEENLSTGLIYPAAVISSDASLHVAERIAAYIFDQGLARCRGDDVGALIRARSYRPVYSE
jgi:malate dehydrogenase (oxaloacetate-decarboxylating)(NADP+)